MERQVKDAIHQLRSRPEFLEVLRLQLQPRNRADAPAPPQVHPVLVSAQKKKSSVEWVDPPKFKKLRKCHTFENDMYGLQNMEQYNRLTLYLQENGDFKPVPVNNRGDCLFASIRWCIDTPAEYTNNQYPSKKTDGDVFDCAQGLFLAIIQGASEGQLWPCEIIQGGV